MDDNDVKPIERGPLASDEAWSISDAAPWADIQYEPMVERPPLAPAKPSRRSRISRTALITASVTALAVGAAVVVAADPAASPTAGRSATTDPATVDTETGANAAAGWVIGELRDGAGNVGLHIGGPFHVTISAIDGSSLDLETDNGWSRTVDTTDVPITKSGAEITVSDLTVGDAIRLEESRADDGTWSVTGIAVMLPHVAGTVASIDADSLTIILRDGSTQTIVLDSDTVYQLGESDGTSADVTAGRMVDVEGTESGDTFTATEVRVAPAFIGGTVTATTADSFSVEQRDGTTATINVDASTEYLVRGVDAATLADVTVDDMVMATGRLNDDGSLDATHVFSGVGFGDGRHPGGLGKPGFGPGGPGGRGHFGGRGFGPGDPSQTDPNTAPDATDDSST